MLSNYFRSIIFLLLHLLAAQGASDLHGKILTGHKPKYPPVTINKVTLTQKGYIQFLRYITDIPTIYDFTFCIWMRSSNLTHSHPLVSYSLHEEERLIRVWISPFGKTANMAIRENLIFKVPVNLRENHWNHICASWETKIGAWMFFLNGKIKGAGIDTNVRGVKIPPGGDLVVGQEYTDFDKGLDDGIEGDIYGFNLALASATIQANPQYGGFNSLHQFNSDRRHSVGPAVNYHSRPMNIHNPHRESYTNHPQAHPYYRNTDDLQQHLSVKSEQAEIPDKEATEAPEVLAYFNTGINRQSKGFDNFFSGIFKDLLPNMQVAPRRSYHPGFANSNQPKRRVYYQQRPTNRRVYNIPTKSFNDVSNVVAKPLGLALVELSYHDCALGRGAPIDDERILISWTKTPVRVFGGAILKTIKPFCV